MTIQVRGFFHDAASTGAYEPFEIADGANVAEFLKEYYDHLPEDRRPEREDFYKMTTVIVNGIARMRDAVIQNGDKVMLLRALGGG